MSVTLTQSYKQFCAPRTVEMIENLMEENYDLEAMLQFIDEHSEDDFYHFYEEYVSAGEEIGYEAVDAYVKDCGIADVDTCEERYMGHYQSTADFAEEYFTDILCESIPTMIVVDWEATWDSALYYDFTACNDGQAYCPIHIFRDH